MKPKIIHTKYLQEKDLLDKLIGPYDLKKVLNLGSADGKYMEYAQFGLEPRVEWYGESILLYPEKEIVNQNLTSTEFPDTSFEAVFCMESIQTISKEEFTNVVEEVYRILRPGGRFIFTIPSALRNHHSSLSSYHFDEIKVIFPEVKWDFKGKYGVQYLTFKNYPKALQQIFSKLDRWMCRYLNPLKANYIVLIFEKEDFAFFNKSR